MIHRIPSRYGTDRPIHINRCETSERRDYHSEPSTPLRSVYVVYLFTNYRRTAAAAASAAGPYLGAAAAR